MKKFLFSITCSIHYYIHIITRFQIFEKGKNAYFIVSSYSSGKICRHS